MILVLVQKRGGARGCGYVHSRSHDAFGVLCVYTTFSFFWICATALSIRISSGVSICAGRDVCARKKVARTVPPRGKSSAGNTLMCLKCPLDVRTISAEVMLMFVWFRSAGALVHAPVILRVSWCNTTYAEERKQVPAVF